jgi:hypothetical protein
LGGNVITFGLHSLSSFSASVIWVEVIRLAAVSLSLIAPLLPCAADNKNQVVVIELKVGIAGPEAVAQLVTFQAARAPSPIPLAKSRNPCKSLLMPMNRGRQGMR